MLYYLFYDELAHIGDRTGALITGRDYLGRAEITGRDHLGRSDITRAEIVEGRDHRTPVLVWRMGNSPNG